MNAPYAEVIEEAAEQLGLEVRQGQAAYELSQSSRLFRAADKLGTEAMHKVETFEKDLQRTKDLLARLEQHFPAGSFLNNHSAAMGSLGGDTIFLLPEVQNKENIMHIALMFGMPKSLKLYLYPQRWYHNLASAIFGLEDIQLGHAQLDPLVIVRADDHDKAQTLLRKPDASQVLLEIFSDKRGQSVVNDLSVRTLLTEVPSAKDIVMWVKRMQRLSVALAG